MFDVMSSRDHRLINHLYPHWKRVPEVSLCLSCLVLSCLVFVLSCLVLSFVLSCLVVSSLYQSCLSCRVLSIYLSVSLSQLHSFCLSNPVCVPTLVLSIQILSSLHLFCLFKSCHLSCPCVQSISSCLSILVSLCLTFPEVVSSCPHSTFNGFVFYRLSAVSTFS